MAFPGSSKFFELLKLSDDMRLVEFMDEFGDRLPLLTYIEEGYYRLECHDNPKILCKMYWITGKGSEKRVMCRDAKRDKIFTIPVDLAVHVSCTRKSGLQTLPLGDILALIELPALCSVDKISEDLKDGGRSIFSVGDVVELHYVYEESFLVGHILLNDRPVVDTQHTGVLLSCPVTLRVCTGVNWSSQPRTTGGLTSALHDAVAGSDPAGFRMSPRRVAYCSDEVPKIKNYGKFAAIPDQSTMHEYHSLEKSHFEPTPLNRCVSLCSIVLGQGNWTATQNSSLIEQNPKALQLLFPAQETSSVPEYQEYDSSEEYEEVYTFPPTYDSIGEAPASSRLAKPSVSSKLPDRPVALQLDQRQRGLIQPPEHSDSLSLPKREQSDHVTPPPIAKRSPQKPKRQSPMSSPPAEPSLGSPFACASPPPHMPQLPTEEAEIRALDVSQVAQCLVLLNMSAYREQFVEEQVDGDLLYALTDDILRNHFRVTPFHVIKLHRFLNGYPPKV